MRIAVRYMAQARHAVGRASEQVELAGPCTLAEFLRQHALAQGEPLRRLLLGDGGELQTTLLIFVGDRQVGPGQPVPLRDGDVVTLLSPMAGG